MSLAEAQPALDQLRERGPDGASRLKRLPSVESVISRVFGPVPESRALSEDDEAQPRDFDVAFDVLRKGAEYLEELQARCVRLQAELTRSHEQHRTDLELARDELLRWQHAAADLKGRYQQSQAQLAEANRISALFEDKAARESRRAEEAERKSSTFEDIAMAFHDQIVTVFGAADARLKDLPED